MEKGNEAWWRRSEFEWINCEYGVQNSPMKDTLEVSIFRDELLSSWFSLSFQYLYGIAKWLVCVFEGK